jgi:hypothetical protein
MEVEIMKGTPRASGIKRVALYVAVGLALGWVTKTIVAPELQTYLSTKDPVEGFRRFRWVMIGIGASLIPVAAYFAILAARIIRSGQFQANIGHPEFVGQLWDRFGLDELVEGLTGQAALDFIDTAEFFPAQRQGKPVDGIYKTIVHFKFDNWEYGQTFTGLGRRFM